MSDINKAARIMRAGNEFSETNRKLREAVYSFIEWIFQALGGYGLPGEAVGWIFRKNDQQIEVSFKMDVGGWYAVTTNSREPQTNSILRLCQALAGPEGDGLVSWLNKETQERSQILTALQTGIEAYRSSIEGQGS